MDAKKIYQPSAQILENYAQVLINFALHNGSGIKPGEVVILNVPEAAKPLLFALNQAVLKAGAHPLIQYLPNEMLRCFFDYASSEQINFFPKYFLKGKVNQADHSLTILAETNKHELEGVDPKKIMDRNRAYKPYYDWLDKKEGAHKFTWTLAMYATLAMAKEANLSLYECWQQIIKACFLDCKKPIEEWQKAAAEINRIKEKLDRMEIQKLHIESKNMDLWIKIGENRVWRGGGGNNIPSFEIFISPDWRGTQGNFKANLPLYRYGNLIEEIELEFVKGRVSKIKAKKGQTVLEEMVKVKNADKIGEFSLTDKRLSRIDKFMAETLFDENFGGNFGNFHLALGSAYKDSFPGEIEKVKSRDWKEMGYNESVIHTDIISSEDRIVTAHLPKGDKRVIYKEGEFTI